MVPRLKELYSKTVIGELRTKFSYGNVMQVPRLEKVVINMGVGDAQQDQRNMDNAVAELTQISGQKPSVRKSKKSISNFKLRQGAAIGCMVTLRGARMYEFLDRLFNVAVPRIRDFRGFAPNSFDGAGNYTIGLKEQTIFPEVKVDSVTRVRGMNITFVVKNAGKPEESRELLRGLGFPFRV